MTPHTTALVAEAVFVAGVVVGMILWTWWR